MFLTTKYNLVAVEPPRLPNSTPTYDAAYIDNLTNVLRIYFNRINNLLAGVDITDSIAGGVAPYGAFSSSVTQTAATNTATVMTYNTNDFTNGVSVVGGSRITPSVSGLYNLQFSVQLQNMSSAPEDVFIWLRQGGVDIPGSTGTVGMAQRKSAGIPFYGLFGWNYFVSLLAGDYVEIWWSPTNGPDVTIPFYPVSSTPTKPATQSVVATLSYVSGLL